jgi:outer membrane protein assembly factor BamB
MIYQFLRPTYLLKFFRAKEYILTTILTAIFLITFLSSCSINKKVDDKNAILAFIDLDPITKDQNLKDVIITFPKAINNNYWFGNNSDNNQIIENFSFDIDFRKKNVEDKSINIGSSFVQNNKMVFAPIIAENKIYVLDNNGNLYAKDLLSYKTIWKAKLSSGLFKQNFAGGKISYFDGKIFSTNGYNLIICFDAKNGKILWQKTLSSILISTPISDGNQLFLITNNNQTYSLATLDGKINWIHSGISKATAILGSANPVFYKNYVISSYSSGEIYALNKKDGTLSWVYDLNLNKISNSDFILNDADATPIIKNNIAYTIGNGGLMMAIRIDDGKVLWQKKVASITDFWIAGDFIYLIDNDNKLICLYKETGGIIWFKQLKKYFNDKTSNNRIIYNGIVMAGDNLIMTNSNKELIIISPLDGEIINTIKLSGQVFHRPILVNKKLYLYLINKFSTSLYII